jgi:ATP-binding cassette, subfamily B, bacterial HlyB/CyaB
LTPQNLAWLVSSLALLHRKPVDVQLLLKQFPPPLAAEALDRALESVGFQISRVKLMPKRLTNLALPAIVQLKPSNDSAEAVPSLLLAVDDATALIAEPGDTTPKSISTDALLDRATGAACEVRLATAAVVDPDQPAASSRRFGFGWFVPELLRHKRIWRDVLIASLVIQLLALGTPLFTQAIIDKVVVHRTESTLIALGVGMALFLIFTSVVSWIRQYLVLHTGNRVDAVLGSAVMEHIFKLPPLYFQHRPTGVIAARLQGVETIREFLASAAVMLILDLPFLLIFVAIMFFYNVTLTFVVLGILAVIVGLSLLVAPIFQKRLNEQFLLGARNQAFVTEYVAGMETVKSLQLEPQLRERYRDYLASFLEANFKTRQLGNTYSTYAQALEQLMTLLVLTIGAWIVMTTASFTIGMLVAFQMFASRVSQPMLKLVGLWQQFQQARLSVERLGDVMNAPTEPYSVQPARLAQGKGAIEIQDLSFRYAENLPFLFERFSLAIQPGSLVAIMGPSGAGKSTLAKLLQGFYAPSSGLIRIDGLDHRHLSANELRANFGVVPQETTLFSGTLFENLQLANPYATFEQVVAACQMAEIHSTIEALPQGYQTPIGERGAGLSGGQKQRIAIARAILKGPKVLIFDEATSSLDLTTAESIARTVNQLKGRVTIVFITHALPRALQVDQIIRIGDKPVAAERSATDAARTNDKPEGVA